MGRRRSPRSQRRLSSKENGRRDSSRQSIRHLGSGVSFRDARFPILILVRIIAREERVPRPLFGTAEVYRKKAEVYEGAGEGAGGVSTRVFHCFSVLLLAISAHGFNGLRSKALLSRQRSESLNKISKHPSRRHFKFKPSIE
jgi:hypothetical protein